MKYVQKLTKTLVYYSLYNKKIIKNSKIFDKIVKNHEKVLEILRDLLYNKHRGVLNAPDNHGKIKKHKCAVNRWCKEGTPTWQQSTPNPSET